MRRRQEPLLSLETILWLQTTSGNRAVQRLLKRKAMQRAGEQQLLQVSANHRQLETLPESQLASIREHRGWCRRVIQWFRKRWRG
jgi:hypothetical protein